MLFTLLRCQRLRTASLWCNSSFQPLATRQFSQTASRSFLRPTPSRFQGLKALADAARQSGVKIDPISVDSPTFYNKITRPGIRRQILFALFISWLAYNVASPITQFETDRWTERMVALSPVWSVKTITNTDLKRAQNAELIQNLRARLAEMQTVIKELPVLIRPWINVALVSVMQPYADASEGKRLCWKICLLNLGIYGAWKIKSLRGFMNTRFMHDPLSGRSYTLLTSMFSHRTAIHLLLNCLALESFGSAAYYHLFREQNKFEPDVLEATTSPHFLAFFVTAGVFSGLVSHVVSAKFRYPRLISQLASSANATKKTETWAGAVAATTASAAAQAPAKQKVLDILPSLGASGAIYAAVTMTALAFPESQVALFIPPSYPIDIQVGVGGLLLLDMIGIIRGWRTFDHWAHLGGAAFGALYYYYGVPAWAISRKILTKMKADLDRERAKSDGSSSSNSDSDGSSSSSSNSDPPPATTP